MSDTADAEGCRRWGAAGPLHSIEKPAPPPLPWTPQVPPGLEDDAWAVSARAQFPEWVMPWGGLEFDLGPALLGAPPWAHQHPGPSQQPGPTQPQPGQTHRVHRSLTRRGWWSSKATRAWKGANLE